MAPKSKTPAVSAPVHEGYEFGGPLGAAAISFGLPILMYVFTFACNDISGCPAPSLLNPKTLDLGQLKREVGWPEDGIIGVFDLNVTLYVLAYYLVNALLYGILPASEVQGTELATGGRLTYRFNAFTSHMIILAVCVAGTVQSGASFTLWTYISDNYLQIFTANLLLATFLATFVYVRSFSVKPGNKEMRELAAGGQTGNMMYDWYIGRELNPRVTLPIIGEMDIKVWFELRPGLLGWLLLNAAWVAQQYRNYGYITDSIAFIAGIQSLYIIDSWINESSILTMIDITMDGFGFMLSFGDIAWVPFLYSTQTRYLSIYPVTLGPTGIAAMLAVLGTGFYIFRSSNNEKNLFRTNPNDPRVSHLEYIQTKTGSKLLVTGWWGTARHINYFGDWIQAWPYSLPTAIAGYTILAAGTGAEGAFVMADGREVVQGAARGWGMLFTYFYVLYFGVLLIHRDGRDDQKCLRKYGDDWIEYRRRVKWRIIPYVY
ncbi:Delta(14)-sterol reductase [Scedosporium apiospermum]|uniref:Delta(14)-sterol reductase n=1 Tax=Pseudallescheria apiosperma TaxID=563466 RepID=A0A084G5L4_PSEDA|nr:Delta(14)-sterol reductase [Scedosporium apiospermum]KEZ42626.1 Delta(14)-sterol reductase [Scedosporium apiospermum]